MTLLPWRELPNASTFAAAGAAGPDVFFAAVGAGVDMQLTPRSCGVCKHWSDVPSAASAILFAWSQSNVWKRDAAIYQRAYGRARSVPDCVLFGVCSTVYFGVAEAGAVIMQAPKKAAIFIVAIRSALRVKMGADEIKVEPGKSVLVDSKDGITVSTWLPEHAARAAGRGRKVLQLTSDVATNKSTVAGSVLSLESLRQN